MRADTSQDVPSTACRGSRHSCLLPSTSPLEALHTAHGVRALSHGWHISSGHTGRILLCRPPQDAPPGTPGPRLSAHTPQLHSQEHVPHALGEKTRATAVNFVKRKKKNLSFQNYLFQIIKTETLSRLCEMNLKCSPKKCFEKGQHLQVFQ